MYARCLWFVRLFSFFAHHSHKTKKTHTKHIHFAQSEPRPDHYCPLDHILARDLAARAMKERGDAATSRTVVFDVVQQLLSRSPSVATERKRTQTFARSLAAALLYVVPSNPNELAN